MQGRTLLTEDADAVFEQGFARPHAQAAEYSGYWRPAGSDAPVSGGLAFLAHPNNIRQPTSWYAIAAQPMSYLNAALLAPEALVLEQGDMLTLRYRLIFHTGSWDGHELAQALDAWTSEL
jgi:hypothetical protein